jgi:hypothetical protein
MVIYCAQPISKGEASKNFFLCCEVQTRLAEAGISCINPGLSVANYGAQRRLTWHQWLHVVDLPVALKADLILRLPGESAGADLEVATCQAAGIKCVGPEFFSPLLDDLFPPEGSP